MGAPEERLAGIQFYLPELLHEGSKELVETSRLLFIVGRPHDEVLTASVCERDTIHSLVWHSVLE
jgi:hypothetical protein